MLKCTLYSSHWIIRTKSPYSDGDELTEVVCIFIINKSFLTSPVFLPGEGDVHPVHGPGLRGVSDAPRRIFTRSRLEQLLDDPPYTVL